MSGFLGKRLTLDRWPTAFECVENDLTFNLRPCLERRFAVTLAIDQALDGSLADHEFLRDAPFVPNAGQPPNFLPDRGVADQAAELAGFPCAGVDGLVVGRK